MPEDITQSIEAAKRAHIRPMISTVLPDGTPVETVYNPASRRTLFCIFREGSCSYEPALVVDGERNVPYSPRNNLLVHEVVLLPSHAEEYGTEAELVGEIQTYLHRYVDVSPLFEKIASYYVLLSWVYDAFNELPYLRLRGDPGTGKTRFLLTLGSICYKPIFASGASTVSPLFRLLDAVRGTLVIDEGDFRLSDEKAEIVKILNNGNARGFPILRSEVNTRKEYSPTAYSVFGPKLVATRGFFEDQALESRCLTEEMGQSRLRSDVPITLPSEQKAESLGLRNKLLLFRFRNRTHRQDVAELADVAIEPRLNQIFAPLSSVVGDQATRDELKALARRYQAELITDRGISMEAQILEVIRDLLASESTPPSVKAITSWFADRHQDEYDRKITSKWIGYVLRRKLHLRSERRSGNFVIPPAETEKLDMLYARYGIPPDGNGTPAGL